MKETPVFDISGKKIWISGHGGMVGSAIIRRLSNEDCEVLTAERSVDLRNPNLVKEWMKDHKPDVVIVAAARVGGIVANNTRPAEFIYDNITIATNQIHAAHEAKVEKLLYLGSSCIYPKHAIQPITEEALLTGQLEPTNEWYAIAKIAGLKMCQAYRIQHGDDFISAMPSNLYGPGDNYDLTSSHVIPALLRKTHEAKVKQQDEVVIWGSGNPLREFTHVDDLADACVFLLKNYSENQHINVGSGVEISIRDLALKLAKVVGYNGRVVFDKTKPDGTARKLMDGKKMRTLGWSSAISFEQGIVNVYEDFRNKNLGV